MAVVVDSIIADLEVRYQQYVEGFDKATAAHGRFAGSVQKLKAFDLAAEGQKYKQAAETSAQADEQATTRITASRKRRSTEQVAADKAVTAAAKAAAKERVQAAKDAAKAEAQAIKDAQRIAQQRAAEEARLAGVVNAARRAEIENLNRLREAERQAGNQVKANAFLTGQASLSGKSAKGSAEVFREQFRIEAAEAKVAAAAERDLAAARGQAAAREARLDANAARRVIREPNIPPAVGSTRLGATVAREASGQTSIPAAVLAGDATAEVAAEREINHLAADRFDLTQRVRAAEGATKQELAAQLDYLRRIAAYKAAGLSEDEAITRAEAEAAAVQRLRSSRSTSATRGVSSGARFIEGAGIGRTGGSPAAVAGIVAASVVDAAVSGVGNAVDFAQQLKAQSTELGVTTKQLQVYRVAAAQANVTDDQFTSGLGQLASNLGRAQEGAAQQSKLFKALNIDIGNARDGFKSAGDILPTLINRLSSIADPARRAAVETALFGEEGRRLDSLLSNGTQAVDNLSDAMARAGSILSPTDIDTLARAGVTLKEVKQQLEVDLARVVAGNADAILVLVNAFSALAQKIAAAGQALTDFFHSGVGQSVVKGVKGAADFLLPDGVLQLFQSSNLSAQPGKPAHRGPSQVNDKLLNSLFAPKGRKGPDLAKQADERAKRADDELARLNDEYLDAERSLTAGADARLALDQEKLRRDYERKNADIQREANEKRIDASRVEQLKAANRKAYLEKLDALNLQRRVEQSDQEAALGQQAAQDYEQELQDESVLAQTARQRRRLALKQLDTERQSETDRLQRTLRSNDPTSPDYNPNVSDQDRALAQQQLDNQDERFGSKRNAVLYGTRGPLEQYRDELPRTAAQINEALQQVEVQGLSSLDDKITDTISRVLKLGGAFGDVANQIISSLIRIAVQKEIIGPLADALFGKSGGDSVVSSIGSAASSIGADLAGARASGGNVVGGRSYLVGEHGPEIVNLGSSGRVYPNGALPAITSRSGGLTLHQTVNIDASGVNPEGYTKAILGVVRRETAQAIRTSSAQTLNATPARIQQRTVLGT